MSLATASKDLDKIAKKIHVSQKARCERIDTLIRELEKAKTCLDTLNADGCAGTRAEEGGTAGEEKSIAKSSARQDAGDVEAMETETETEIETRMDTEPSLHPGSNPVEAQAGSEVEAGANQAAVAVLQDLEACIAGTVNADAMAADDKELNTLLSKFNKAVDKLMPPDLAKAVNYADFQPHLLNQVMLEHLLRCGRIEVARVLSEEADLPLNQLHVSAYQYILEVVDEIKKEELQKALAFVESYQEQITNKGLLLGLRVHQRRFFQLLQNNDPVQAVAHARLHFPPFYKDHGQEIRESMGCIAWVKKGFLASPYHEYFAQDAWQDLAQLFWQQGCEALGVEHEQPLGVCVNAGIKALPTLLKFATVMQGRSDGWSSSKTILPVEVELGPRYQYHSVFICPVSREQSAADNAPMMMQCGHVLCQQSLRKLSRTGGRFKCPYCPAEVSVSGSQRLVF